MALTAEIVERVVGGEADKRLQIAGGAYMRKLAIGNDWTMLRVGMRWSTSRATNWTSPPFWYVGLMPSIASPPGAASNVYFLGHKKANIDDISVSTYWRTSSSFMQETSFANSVEYSYRRMYRANRQLYLPLSSNGSAMVLFDFQKIAGGIVQLSSRAYSRETQLAVTPSEFSAYMQVPAFAEDAMVYMANGSNEGISLRSIYDESTNPALDTFCFSWLGEGVENAFEISDIAVRRLA